jgi:hypothetical protein
MAAPIRRKMTRVDLYAQIVTTPTRKKANPSQGLKGG